MKADSGKKKKIIPIMVILIIIVVVLVFLVPQFLGGTGKRKQVTSAQLEKVVNIDQLYSSKSTVGIAGSDSFMQRRCK